MTTWLFSDPHFNHEKIWQWRGFTSLEHHDNYMLFEINKVVKPTDTIWFGGDMILNPKTPEILEQINGNKKLVLGNHDTHAKIEKYYRGVFSKIVAYHEFHGKILLSHIPVHPSQLENRWRVNIHGHMHKGVVDDDRYFNICADAISLTPINLDKVINHFKKIGAWEDDEQR